MRPARCARARVDDALCGQAQDKLGRTPVQLAAEARHTAAAMLLRAHGGQCSPVSGARRASAAARSGQKAVLQHLVELAGVPLDSADETGKSLLHAAAAAGHPAVCLWLVSARADLDREDLLGRTALDDAVCRGRHFLAKLLVNSGATKTKSKEIGRLLRAPSWQTVLYHKARQEAQEDELGASERAADDLAQQLDDVQARLEDAERVAGQLRGLNPEATGQLHNASAKALLAACGQQVAALSPFDAVLCRNWLHLERVVGFLRQRLARHAAALHRPAGFEDCLCAVLRDLGFGDVPTPLLAKIQQEIRQELGPSGGAPQQDPVDAALTALLLSKSFAALARSARAEHTSALFNRFAAAIDQLFVLIDSRGRNVIEHADVQQIVLAGCACSPELASLGQEWPTAESQVRLSKHALSRVLLVSYISQSTAQSAATAEPAAIRPRIPPERAEECRDAVVALVTSLANDAVDRSLDRQFDEQRSAQGAAPPQPAAAAGGRWALVQRQVSSLPLAARMSSHIAKVPRLSADVWRAVNPTTKDHLRLLFDLVDSDGSGILSRGEVAKLIGGYYSDGVSEDLVDSFIHYFDVDGDGAISWEEFEGSWATFQAASRGRFRKKRGSRVVMPNSQVLHAWRGWLRLCCAFYFLSVPFRIAFVGGIGSSPSSMGGSQADPVGPWDEHGWTLWIDYAVDIMFAFDIYIKSRTAFVNEQTGKIETAFDRTWSHYLTHGFFSDFVACVPLDIFARLCGAPMWAWNWLRTLKLFHLRRLRALMRNRRRRSSWFATGRDVCLLYGCMHLCACAWACAAQASGGRDGRQWGSDWLTSGNPFDYYVVCLFYTAALLTGTAPELQATNAAEVAATGVILLLHLTVFQLLILDLFTSLALGLAAEHQGQPSAHTFAPGELPQRSSRKGAPAKEMPAKEVSQSSSGADVSGSSLRLPDAHPVHRHLARTLRSVDSDIASQVLQHAKSHRTDLPSRPGLRLMDFLNPALQTDVAIELSRNLAERSVFSVCSAAFRRRVAIALATEEQSVMPAGAKVWHGEDVATFMVFLTAGAVELEDGARITAPAASSGASSSEAAGAELVCGAAFGHSAHVSSAGAATCYMLHLDTLQALLQDFPADQETLVRKFEGRPQAQGGQLVRDDALSSNDPPAPAGSDLTYPVAHLLRSVHLGDLRGVEAILDDGVCEVNDLDLNSRSALHIASLDGNAEMVERLLARSASPDLCDARGSTALDDAIGHGHREAARLLASRGATVGGETMCRLAARRDGESHDETMQLMLGACGGSLPTDANGRTALHVAAMTGDCAALLRLMENAPTVGLARELAREDLCGMTALDCATSDRATRQLEEAGARSGSFSREPAREAGLAVGTLDEPSDAAPLESAPLLSQLENSVLLASGDVGSSRLIERASDAVMVTAVEGNGSPVVSAASRGLGELLGEPPEGGGWLGQFDELLRQIGLADPNPLVEPARSMLLRNMATQKASALQLPILDRTGTRRWVLWQVWPIRELAGSRSSRQIHCLKDKPFERCAAVASMKGECEVVIRGIERMCSTILQLAFMVTTAGGEGGDVGGDGAEADWAADKEALRARVRHLLRAQPAVLSEHVAEARRAWRAPMTSLRRARTEAISAQTARLLGACAWRIDSLLRGLDRSIVQRTAE